MNVPLAGIILILIALLGGTMAMAAFIWSVRSKQFKNLNEDAYMIFDDEEPVGEMTDRIFDLNEDQKPRK